MTERQPRDEREKSDFSCIYQKILVSLHAILRAKADNTNETTVNNVHG